MRRHNLKASAFCEAVSLSIGSSQLLNLGLDIAKALLTMHVGRSGPMHINQPPPVCKTGRFWKAIMGMQTPNEMRAANGSLGEPGNVHY